MFTAVLAGCLGLAVVLVALYAEPEPGRAKGAEPSRGVADGALPAPLDFVRPDLRLRPLGYDPVAVEVHFEALRRSYDDLYAAATPQVLARAARRRGATTSEGREEAPLLPDDDGDGSGSMEREPDAEELSRSEAAGAVLAPRRPDGVDRERPTASEDGE